MKEQYRVVELFSGIGSQAAALNNIGLNIDVVATSEWDIQAFIAYDYIHNGKHISKDIKKLERDELLTRLSSYSLSKDGKTPMKKQSLSKYSDDRLKTILSSIENTKNLVDISKVKGSQMPSDIDILTYSFPCQDLSNVGAFHGYLKGIDKNSGSRSSLLWEVGRILKEINKSKKNMPRYLVMENVPTLLSERHIKNFNMWKKDLKKLGYISKEFKLNAKDFGIPQHRPRLLMLSVYVGKDKNKIKAVDDYFKKTTVESIVKDFEESKYYKKLSIKDLLRLDYSKEKYLSEALSCNPNDTPSRRKIWENNPQIIDSKGDLTKENFIRTLTTKQDRHPNSGNVYFDSKIKGKSKWRYLTPRECLLFMGFKEKDYESLIKNDLPNDKLFSRDKIIRMAGNSIPVQLLEGFFYQIYSVEEIVGTDF